MLGNAWALPSLKEVWTSFLAYAVELLGAFRAQGAAQETSDEELAKRMHDGDDAAFEQLYGRYFDKIYAFVLRRVGHAATAEDLVSDIFMKAFAHRRTFVWKTSFSAWIYRIATNRITDHYRTKKPTEELVEERHDQPANIPGAPQEADRKMIGIELEAVLEKLGERERMAVTMKFYGECDNAEIAQALNCTPNNAGVILHRALKKCEQHAGERLKSYVGT